MSVTGGDGGAYRRRRRVPHARRGKTSGGACGLIRVPIAARSAATASSRREEHDDGLGCTRFATYHEGALDVQYQISVGIWRGNRGKEEEKRNHGGEHGHFCCCCLGRLAPTKEEKKLRSVLQTIKKL
ncbi:hypothetical protein F2Q68_00001456 [Brassica cretica]|uniref:Uncharacterized protein n=1 Tax=Brassica cretica TaxID=69181 RepID=A0A8S9JGH5_BRACR|nr:hypothetical protein F2Q68_00001456 [Brassica cretica]